MNEEFQKMLASSPIPLSEHDKAVMRYAWEKRLQLDISLARSIGECGKTVSEQIVRMMEAK